MARPMNRDMRLAWQFRENRGVMPNSASSRGSPFPSLGSMRKRRDYADIRKANWGQLAPDELGAVMANLSSRELYCKQLSVRGRLRRRRLEAVALFRQIHGPLKDKWFWVSKSLRTPRFETKPVKFRWKPMWHLKRA